MTVNLSFTGYISGNSVEYVTLIQNIFQICNYLINQHDASSLTPSVFTTLFNT